MYQTKVTTDNIFQIKSVSKGSQSKWIKDNYWYKVDNLGKEGLAEWVAYNILECSTLNTYEYANYELCDIKLRGVTKSGCKPKNFISCDDQIRTIYSLIKHSNFFLKLLSASESLERKIALTVELAKNLTGIDITNYLRKVLTLDAIILNQDRHVNNIAIIESNDDYKVCPIFDNGASLGFNVLNQIDEIDIYCENVIPKYYGYTFEDAISLLGYEFKIYRKPVFDFIDTNYDILKDIAEILYY